METIDYAEIMKVARAAAEMAKQATSTGTGTGHTYNPDLAGPMAAVLLTAGLQDAKFRASLLNKPQDK